MHFCTSVRMCVGESTLCECVCMTVYVWLCVFECDGMNVFVHLHNVHMYIYVYMYICTYILKYMHITTYWHSCYRIWIDCFEVNTSALDALSSNLADVNHNFHPLCVDTKWIMRVKIYLRLQILQRSLPTSAPRRVCTQFSAIKKWA